MKMNKLGRLIPVLAVAIAGLGITAYNLKAQPSDSARQAEQNPSKTNSRSVLLRQRGLKTLSNSSKHVELHFLRNGYDCYISGRRDKNGALHDVVMRSYFLYKLRNSCTSKLSDGVFPEVCLAKSMSPDSTVPNQWILEGAMYHIFKTDGTQLQETPTNAQQPKTIMLLPVKT
ncbi:MAG TPA: hypothetical protein VF600_18215 [Abditibacteriaceae bacterium]|jgi:hypothetical protein